MEATEESLKLNVNFKTEILINIIVQMMYWIICP